MRREVPATYLVPIPAMMSPIECPLRCPVRSAEPRAVCRKPNSEVFCMTLDVCSLSDSVVPSDSKSAEPIQTQSMPTDTPALCPNYVCTPAVCRQRRVSRSTLARRLVRTREAATYLALSEWKIRKLVRNGQIPYIDDGKSGPWRFDLRDLDAYVERYRQKSG